MFKINIITIFPEVFPGLLDISILARARRKKIWDLNTVDIKSFAEVSKGIDDKPYGGGPGMIIKADILQKAYEKAKNEYTTKDLNNVEKIMLSPQGQELNQRLVEDLSKKKGMILISGRYEGVDERFINYNNLKKVSIGKYILCGGEAAASVLCESVIRLLPNVLGNADSKSEESFSNGLLEYPQFTKPRVWNNLKVPEILFSGNHKNIKQWRKEKSSLITEQIIKKNTKNDS